MVGDAKKTRIVIILALTIAGLLMALPAFAQQQNTNVNFELCGNEIPTINVTSPQTDSVTNLPNVTLSGTAAHTTQIEVSLNGNLDQSIAIGQQSDEFTTTLTLQQGTNSILLTAYYSCNSNTSSEDLIVTYQPNSTASEGGQISTVAPLPDDDNLPTVSNPADESLSEGDQSLPERLAENLGLGASINESIVRPVASWVAMIISVGAAFMAISPMYFSAKLFDFLGFRKLQSFGKAWRVILRILLGFISILLALFVQA